MRSGLFLSQYDHRESGTNRHQEPQTEHDRAPKVGWGGGRGDSQTRMPKSTEARSSPIHEGSPALALAHDSLQLVYVLQGQCCP